MLEQILSYIIVKGSMWGLIGSIIVLIVNLIVANSVKKKSLRSYVLVESTADNPDLEDNVLKKGTKLILTEEYKKYRTELREESYLNEKELRYNFIKIKNISSNPCFGVEIKFTLQDSLGTKKFEIIDIYVLEGNDELYIPSISFNTMVYQMKMVEVEYTTVANEKMIYINQTRAESEGKDSVKHSMYVRKWWGNRKVVMTTGSSLRWEIIK